VLKASRPLSILCGILLLGNGMMHSPAIQPGPLVLLHLVWLTFTFSIPVSIIAFGVNDVYDYETDRRNPRKLADGIEGGVLEPVYHKDVLIAAYFSTIAILLSAVSTRCRDNILATVLILVIAWQYSAPPLRIKEIPFLDSLSNGCLVFLIWFFGFSLTGSSISEVPLRPIMNHLCAVAGHAMGAVADYEADAAVGQSTIATAMGKRLAVMFAAVCFVAGSLAIDPVGNYPWLSSAMVLLPCLDVAWTHTIMRGTAALGITSHVFQVVRKWRSGVGLDCMVEVIFDIPFMPLVSSCSALASV